VAGLLSQLFDNNFEGIGLLSFVIASLDRSRKKAQRAGALKNKPASAHWANAAASKLAFNR